jgi:S1-C subfamily serine protease
MFARAVQIAQGFTRPLIVSTRLTDGTVTSGCAAFVIVNDDGWMVTAGHVMSEMAAYQQQSAAPPGAGDPPPITNVSYWWGKDGVTVAELTVDGLADLAVGRLEPFDRREVLTYPTFGNSARALLPGTALCRLGFPFHAIGATFIEATGQFQLAEGTLPLPLFPLDGIHTRLYNVVDPTSHRQASFIEVSTPGLRGQSGGPVFDPDGIVWGIQSRTVHLPLGFNPKVAVGDREIEEHQFLNVGLAAHVDEVVRLLRSRGANVAVSGRPG